MATNAATATLQDALLPQPPGGLRAGALLAMLVHVALVAALALGVQWRASAPELVTAELWSAMPQVAAPRAEEPVPPPPAVEPAKAPEPVQHAPEPDPQIAIEQERQKRQLKDQERAQKLEAVRIERERQTKLEQAQREAREKRELAERKTVEDKLAKQREDNLRRMMGQAGAAAVTGATGAPTATGNAAMDAAPSRSYAGKLVAHIKPHIVFTDSITTSSAAEVEVRAASSGAIVSRRLVKSSGSKEWDEAVLRAIDRTGSLPRDTDGRVPGTIIVSFRPQE